MYYIISIILQAIIICLIQHFEADFPKKVSLKILNSGIILKIFTHDIWSSTLALYHKHYITSYYNLPKSAFWGWLSKESQPQNPEFRNKPENFYPWYMDKHTSSFLDTPSPCPIFFSLFSRCVFSTGIFCLFIRALRADFFASQLY